jgi:hypothetical protein
MSFMSVEINPKRIDLVRAILPACRHIAVLSNVRRVTRARLESKCPDRAWGLIAGCTLDGGGPSPFAARMPGMRPSSRAQERPARFWIPLRR